MSQQDKEIIELIGFKQSEIARLLGVSRQTIWTSLQKEKNYITLFRLHKMRESCRDSSQIFKLNNAIEKFYGSEVKNLAQISEQYYENSPSDTDVDSLVIITNAPFEVRSDHYLESMRNHLASKKILYVINERDTLLLTELSNALESLNTPLPHVKVLGVSSPIIGHSVILNDELYHLTQNEQFAKGSTSEREVTIFLRNSEILHSFA